MDIRASPPDAHSTAGGTPCGPLASSSEGDDQVERVHEEDGVWQERAREEEGHELHEGGSYPSPAWSNDSATLATLAPSPPPPPPRLCRDRHEMVTKTMLGAIVSTGGGWRVVSGGVLVLPYGLRRFLGTK